MRLGIVSFQGKAMILWVDWTTYQADEEQHCRESTQAQKG